MDTGTIKFNSYKLLKVSVLMLYGYFLYLNNLLTFENRLKMHLILVPIFKLFNFMNGNNKRPFSQVLYSMVTDNIMAFIHFRFYLTCLTGNYYTYFILCTVILFLIIESLEFYLFPEGSYLIKVRNGIGDFCLLPCAMLLLYYASTIMDFNYEPSPYTFGWFFLWMIFSDIFFGMCHVLMHKIEYLWKTSHSIHHEYKLENVNCFANFYADTLDSFVMMGALIIPLLCFQMITGINLLYFIYVDGYSAAVNTHNKYVSNHITIPFFFEYDLLDQTFSKIFGIKQASEWHHHHHLKTSSNYTAFGFIDEKVIIFFADSIISLFGLKVNFKKDEEKDD